MSNYKAGDIIRLTRLSMGMSQEELSANICSLPTLSRIENGRTSVKKDTYRKLMERMGRNGEKIYAQITPNDLNMMDVMDAANTALKKQEYEKLDHYTQKLKPYLNESKINIQYIRRKELIADYKLGRISNEIYLREMEKLIDLTIPNYKDFIHKVYPFFEHEIGLLITISNAYGDKGENNKKIEILNMLLNSLNAGYMDIQNTERLKIILLNNMAKGYGEIGEHQKAVNLVEEAITIAKRNKFAITLSNLYGEIAWNMVEQIKKGERDRKEVEVCKKYLRQGYAIASLYKKNNTKRVIKEIYEESFNEKIY